MPTYHVTQDEMEEIYSETGLMLRMDDVDPDDFTITLDNIRLDATETINSYLFNKYDESDLTSSRWVRRRTAFIACYFLSIRRGNPAQFLTQYEDARADLEDVMNGKLFIPGVATNENYAPVMSNFAMIERYRMPMRVRTELSVGGTYGRQFQAYSIPYMWL
ncbi:MAG: phage protein Gp36 family protein [Candidatus Thorarchaeota archaeon]